MSQQGIRAEAEFASDLAAPRRARAWLGAELAPLRLDPLTVEQALLLASELVTNVIVHTDSPPTVALSVERDRIEIGVTDRGEALAVAADRGPEQVGGWGLRLVDEIATAWGVRYLDTGAKVVWFEIDGARSAATEQGE